MWAKPTESRRLTLLRQAATEAFAGAPPLAREIRITLRVHVGPINDERTGDLDNFITGVCDGLMPADPRSKLEKGWSKPEHTEIHPDRTIGIKDDSQVIQVDAKKVVGDTREPWYEVILEGET